MSAMTASAVYRTSACITGGLAQYWTENSLGEMERSGWVSSRHPHQIGGIGRRRTCLSEM